ncbi:hypothetical protein J7384_03580 [Endozoicomonas sp. G2_1]|uniref:YajG family lipoprotein n=1 Tax=Endozoicomonas sp. G2_1 TaxID=2821091 RepID=UPI001AD99C7C|nr:YajG family lipoprotein [Endozoicomonas sp. G2_1]MBO9489436.1 hypothetical protein [Endozoicomonas sp. G2_1]
MMTIKHITSIALISLMTILSGCASKPNNIIVAIDYVTPAPLSYANSSANIKAQDLRPQQHIVQIRKKDQAARLISSANSLTKQIAAKASQGFKQQALTIDQHSQKQITLVLQKALIDVEQSLVKHKTKSEITLQVQAIVPNLDGHGYKSFSKNFNTTSTSEMPLTPDIAVLERDFNQSLARVINNIIADEELHQFITQ